jgi:hypothetical protein
MVAELTKDFYSTREVRERYGWSAYQVRNQIKLGTFPNIVGSGQNRRIPKSDLQAYDEGKTGVTTPAPEPKSVSPAMRALLDRQKLATTEKATMELESQTLEAERKLAEEKKLRDLPEVLYSKEQELKELAIAIDKRDGELTLAQETLATQRTQLLELNSTLKTKELELVEKEKAVETECLTKRADADTYCETKMNELSALSTKLSQDTEVERERLLTDAKSKADTIIADANAKATEIVNRVKDWYKHIADSIGEPRLVKYNSAIWWNSKIKLLKESPVRFDESLTVIIQWCNYIRKLDTIGKIKEYLNGNKTVVDFAKAVKEFQGTTNIIASRYNDVTQDLLKVPALTDESIGNAEAMPTDNKVSEVKENENN